MKKNDDLIQAPLIGKPKKFGIRTLFNDSQKFPIISGFNENANFLGKGAFGQVILVYYFKEMKILATKSFKDDKYFIFLKNNREYKKEKDAYSELRKKVIGIEDIAIMVIDSDD